MGYKRRERYLDYRYYDTVFDRSGNVTFTILVNGKITGVWDYSEAEEQIKVFLWDNLNDEIIERIFTGAQQFGQFISGKAVRVSQVRVMIPIKERPPGAFISPLRGR